MKKNIPYLRLFKLSYFFLFITLPSVVNAALIQIDPHANYPVQLEPKGNYPPNDYTIDTLSNPLLPSNNAQLVQPKLYDLKAQGKKLLNAYQDNELLSKSLNSLSQARQLWINADTLATDFAYDLLFSLELDQFIQSEIAITPDLHDIGMGLTTQKTQSIPFPINQASTINYNLYNTQLKGQANTSTQGTDHLTNFLNGLLHITTLHYLAALLILISFLQWLIPFLLRLFP